MNFYWNLTLIEKTASTCRQKQIGVYDIFTCFTGISCLSIGGHSYSWTNWRIMGTSTTDVVQVVKFGFMSDEEVRRQSLVKITNPNLVDILDKPIPGGLYDPAMGPPGNEDSP